MSKYYNLIKDIVESKGETYAELYPEISKKDVFSISTLSHRFGAKYQINWKIKGTSYTAPYYSPLGKAFFEGRAVHEFIQKRLQKFGFQTEYPVLLSTPTYKLIGHIDAISMHDKFILDIKTTKEENWKQRLNEYIQQIATYTKIMENEIGFRFDASVFVFNGKKITSEEKRAMVIYEYELTRQDIELGYQLILKKAEEAYNKLKEMKII